MDLQFDCNVTLVATAENSTETPAVTDWCGSRRNPP